MGGNGAVIVQILGVLLILFFFFLTYMFTKTWRWHHVMFAFLIFPAAITLAVYASLTLKTRAAWQAKHKEIEAAVQTAEAAVEKLHNGDSSVGEASIQEMKSELARLMLDRGRVWRHAVPNNGQLVQTPAGPRPQADLSTVPQGEEPKPHQLQPNDVLYVFTEAQTPEGMWLPDVYIGEFRVTATPSETDVTIVGQYTPDPVQAQVLQQGGVPWALYELMPRDNHYAFTQTEADDDHVYGTVDENSLRTLFKNRYNLPADEYEQMVQSYLRDGTQVQPDDPPTTRWARVEFLVPHDYQVDVVAQEGVLETDYFDSSGRAADRSLWHTEAGDGILKFAKGAIGFFPEEEANRLVEQKIAKIDAPIYVRALSDYAYMFWNTNERLKDLNNSIYLIQRETKDITIATAATQQSIDLRTDERDKLEDDLKMFETERDEVKQYQDVLAASWNALRNRASLAYRANRDLETQLETASDQLTNEINRRTREVTSTRP